MALPWVPGQVNIDCIDETLLAWLNQRRQGLARTWVSEPPKGSRPSPPHRPCWLQTPTEHGVRKVFWAFLAITTPTIPSTVIAAPGNAKRSGKRYLQDRARWGWVGSKLIDVTSGGNDETTARAEAEVYRLDLSGERRAFVQMEFDLCCVVFACAPTVSRKSPMSRKFVNSNPSYMYSDSINFVPSLVH